MLPGEAQARVVFSLLALVVEETKVAIMFVIIRWVFVTMSEIS